MSILLLLCLITAPTVFAGSTDPHPVSHVPPRIQALLTAKPDKRSLPVLSGFIKAPAFARLSRSERLRVLDAAWKSALVCGEFYTAARFARRSAPLQADALLADLRKKNADGYACNRARLTTIPGNLRNRITTSACKAAKAGLWNQAGMLFLECLRVFPEAPDARTTARVAARYFLKSDHPDPAHALVCLLHALDTGLDRCFVPKARFPVNQTMLDAVAGPPEFDSLKECVDLLSKACGLLGNKSGVRAPPGAAWVRGWHEVLCQTYRPPPPNWNAWSKLTESSPGALWRTVSGMACAREYLRRGLGREALDVLAGIDPALRKRSALGRLARLLHRPSFETRLLSAHCAFLRGLALRGMLRFPEAAEAFSACLDAPDPILVERARFELARTYELAFDWDRAEAEYRQVARSGSAWRMRQLAECALRRLADYRETKTAAAPRVSLLPDDRTSHGDWYYGYGKTGYALCAQHFTLDRTAGYFKKHKVRYSTTDPREPHGRLWVSKEAGGEDPAALWDPRRRKHFPSNRDDRGEQYPLGKGPDLIATVDVPAGSFVLSFYFVNDHNFYEDNRRYTVQITDEGGNLLALADVRDFGTGVYKRFVVGGPLTIHCRIRRDMSLNVLLSGVFLDPFLPLRPVPECVLAVAQQRGEWDAASLHLRHLADAYVQCSQRLLLDGAAAPASIAEVAELASRAERIRVRSSRSARHAAAAAATWMESECRSFLGQTRRAERLFDKFLDACTWRLDPEDIIPFFRRLASETVVKGPGGDRAPCFRVADAKIGRHRLSRLWERAFRAVQRAVDRAEHREDPVTVAIVAGQVSRLAADDFPGKTARAVELAASFLEKHPSRPLPTSEAWLVAARLRDLEFRPQQALDAIRRGIDLAGPEARFAYWLELVNILDHAQAPGAEVEKAFQRLAARLDPSRKKTILPAAASAVACSFMREKQYAQALKYLERWSPRSPLVRRCRECLARRTSSARGKKGSAPPEGTQSGTSKTSKARRPQHGGTNQ